MTLEELLESSLTNQAKINTLEQWVVEQTAAQTTMGDSVLVEKLEMAIHREKLAIKRLANKL